MGDKHNTDSNNKKTVADYAIYAVGGGIVALGAATLFAAAVAYTQEPEQLCVSIVVNDDSTMSITEPVPCDPE